ncbi:BTAD domain-containing putative transcriptional regulator [Tsukamurella paurometabola]|uniref:Winged helix-turn-helix domain-containing protein n=1 Tax=Tsukamurella paurometabola TaxID=2061 RepID=A0ABS5NJ10_TSUPA|nr:BTAD domain-containing putative transcriptional regulator [Tsukamurella paurometabola]MBS4104263.1 winged helix-turn-helix domain-containing protein [Tsukamurella paurometabola]
MHDGSAPDDAAMIGVLGPVVAGGRPVPGVRARRLLVTLVLADGRPVSADRLVDDVWGDAPPKSPHAALHTQVSRVRAVVRPARLEAVAGGYRLEAESDLARAEAALRDGSGAAEALRLWRGIPGDDLDDGGPAAELARRAADALHRLEARVAAEALAAGDVDTARAIAERRIAADPLDEPARVLLMRALAGAGRTAEALAAYADLRRVSITELGAEPGEEAARLHRELLAGAAPVPAGPTTAPAPRAAAVGLPAEVTPLVGRADQVAELVRAVDEARVVTVLGPGGVGKTRIAEAVGAAVADAGTAVYYVPLAAVRSGGGVLPAVSRVLGLAESDLGPDGMPRRSVRDLGARVLEALGRRRCLVVLDNCEQVIDACADVVTDLVSGAPGVTVLATSRSPLQIRAERVHPLPVLATAGADSAAVELFAQRARAVRPDVALPEDAVAELCRRLDGLPLAIELAAARVRTLSVEEITDRLAQRFALLRSADRSAPDRHRTLYAVIAWSWDLLEPDAQWTLRRLCRFPAGFDTEAASAVTGLDTIALDDALISLANQSLLHVAESGGRTRYRMLETVREFGEERLAEAPVAADGTTEGAAVDRAMASWAATLAAGMWSEYRSVGGHGVIARLADDLENLAFVLRGAVDDLAGGERAAARTVIRVFPLLAGLWSMRSLHAQVQELGIRIVHALPDPREALAAGLSDEDRELWQATVLAACAAPGANPKARHVVRGRTMIRRLHRPERALLDPAEYFSSAFLQHSVYGLLRLVLAGVASPVDDVRLHALAARMNLRENSGDLTGALEDSVEIAAIGGHGDAWTEAMLAMSTASIYGQQARWSEAEQRYRTAVEKLASIGADEDAKQATAYLVASLCSLGRIDEAEALHRPLQDGWSPSDPDPDGGPEAVAAMMIGAAELARLRGAPDAALYRRAGELLVRRIPNGSRDPGGEMLVAIALLGVVACGAPETGRTLVDALIAGDEAMFGVTGYWDLPQAATMALAVGAYLVATDPASEAAPILVGLARRLGARQDYPVMHAAMQRLQVPPDGVPAQAWRAEVDRIAALSRSRAVRLLRDTTAALRRRA